MNKLNILFLGALVGMGMVACDDKLPVVPPQANEQGPVLEGFAGATASLTTNSIDLQTAIEEGSEYITIYSVNAGSSGVPQADIWGELEVSNNADFNPSVILSEAEGLVGAVSVSELNEAHIQLFGLSPKEKEVYYRVLLYANVEGSTYRIGSKDTYGAQGTFTEICDPGFSIDESYYIIGVEGWEPSDCVLMDHSEESAYDDPVFTYSFSSEGTIWWKIVPADIYAQVGEPGFDAGADFWPNIYSVLKDGDNAYEGSLKIEDGPSGEIPAGDWTISVNMKNLTYTVSGTPAGMPEWIGTPNTFQEWKIDTSMRLNAYGEDYKGFSYFGGEWGGKLGYSAGDKEIWLGKDDSFEPIVGENSNDPTWEFLLSDSGGNIFEGGEPEMYFINYNFPSKKAIFHKIITCGIIGGFNDWGAQVPMTAVAGSNDMKWTITYTFDSDTEFKFRCNDNWDVNLGGDINNLTVNGNNISASAGTYEITLDITNVPYSCTIAAK